MAQAIKRGIIQSFDPTTYTASVLLIEATSAFLTGVPISATFDGTSTIPGAYCAVLFFDETNYQDGCIIAVYPNSTNGVPVPPPGRVTFLTPFVQVNAAAIPAGTTNAYTLVGGGSGIPSGILGVLYKAFFTSANVGALIQIGPHGAALLNYHAIGEMQVAGRNVNGSGIIQVDASGTIDIKATAAGACTVSFITHGYII